MSRRWVRWLSIGTVAAFVVGGSVVSINLADAAPTPWMPAVESVYAPTPNEITEEIAAHRAQVAAAAQAAEARAVAEAAAAAARRQVRPKPAPRAAPAPQPESATTPTPSGWSVNWDAIAQCESGGDWSINTGNGYEGGLQFLNSTWLSNGGGDFAQHAYDATKEQQIIVAERLYANRGVTPWPTCGRYG